jgi:hypothetical protein
VWCSTQFRTAHAVPKVPRRHHLRWLFSNERLLSSVIE